MKFVILIHSNPQPWGHPTGDFTPEYQALPAEQRDRMMKAFEDRLTEMQESGELITGEALDAPVKARVYHWRNGNPYATDGPYAESKEHLAGFFLIDVKDQARAEEIVADFAGPGETVELRPVYTWES
jgi:hypothetical protein